MVLHLLRRSGERARGSHRDRRGRCGSYSLAEPSTPDGPTLGTPNTFVFAFRNGAAANSAPNAVDDTLVTGQGSAATVNVLVNDSDPNNDPLSVTTFTQGAMGRSRASPTATAPTRRRQASSAATASSTRSRTEVAAWIPRPFASRWGSVGSGPTVDAGGDGTVAEGRCSRGRVRLRIGCGQLVCDGRLWRRGGCGAVVVGGGQELPAVARISTTAPTRSR